MATCSYLLDPTDPRAPSTEQWATMSETERQRAVEALPSELPRETAPEGDEHRDPKEKALEALREYYRRLGRSVYLSAELPVYYPAERVFAPDVIAVLDVDPHPRQRWAVLHEGKGLDFALEITLAGDRKKDLEDNVMRYAALGIPEYFVLDLRLNRILGYRLSAGRGYEPIVPQAGRWASQILGLDLALELGRVRFFSGSAPLPHADELIARLDEMVRELVAKEQDLARALEEAQAEAEREKARAEQQRAEAEREKARAERLAARLRELGVDVEDE
ncbi:MAG: Uma2 family endonuclease [Polyangiaceae bacterium]|nr:Uma2 family endonuclease [Polyangiaceae bacterium]